MSEAVLGATAPPAANRSGSGRIGDLVFEWMCRLAGLVLLLTLGGIIVTLFIGGLPALKAFGPQFVWSTAWQPVEGRENFGAGIAILGTVVASILAILMAVPLAFGVAFFLTELAPDWLKRPVGTAIELLAAVPSIIFGMWGLFIVVPLIQQYIQLSPFGEALGELPLIGALFVSNSFTGTSLFAASLVLAIMILPFIAATMRDVFTQVPPVLKESAYGLGCTRWEVVRNIVLPYTRSSVVGGIMLGLGRALGETMAVTFVIGNANRIATSIFDPTTTIASVVAMEFPESLQGSLQQSSLLLLGFLLFVISFIVLATSRYLLRSKLKA